MAKYCGKDLLLQVEDSPSSGTYTTVGYLRTNGLSINRENVDVTTKSDVPWRQLLGCGIISMSLSGEGVFSDSASLALVQDAILSASASIINFKMVSGAGDSFTGAFEVTTFDRNGEYNGEEAVSISLENAGQVTYA